MFQPKFFSRLLPVLLLSLPLSSAVAQGSAVADVGFTYRNLEHLPGRSPFRKGSGFVEKTDGSSLKGYVRVQSQLSSNLVVRDSATNNVQVFSAEKVKRFFIEGHAFAHLKEAFPNVSKLPLSLSNSEWVEILVADANSTLGLFEIHGGQRHSYIVNNYKTGAVTVIPANLPPRGFDDDFESSLRLLFADRPDLLAFIPNHHLTAFKFAAAIRAYNSGEKMKF